MGIGVTVGKNVTPKLSEKLAQPGVTGYCWPNAAVLNIPIYQGSDYPVGALGSCSSDLLAPPIPGGLQYEKVVIVVKEQPVRSPNLVCLIEAINKIHVFVNFTMTQPGYFTP